MEEVSEYDSKKLELDAGETITNAILYGDGKGSALGHIYIETSNGKKFDYGRDISDIDPYEVDVGSGLLMGAKGQYNSDYSAKCVINLGLLFLNQPIKSVEVTNIEYDTTALENKGKVNPKSIDVGSYYNGAGTNGTAKQSHKSTVVKSHEYVTTVKSLLSALILMKDTRNRPPRNLDSPRISSSQQS